MTYFVYELWNPIKNQPFYVGFGKRADRPKDHISEALKVGSEYKAGANPHKIYTIRSIHMQGLEVDIKIVYEVPDKKSAIDKEVLLISKYGRKNIGNGILTNMTDGGEGAGSRIISDAERRCRSIRKLGRSFVEQFGEEQAKVIKEKIAKSRKGHKSKFSAWNKGQTASSNQSVKKISDSKKGSVGWNKGIKMAEVIPGYVNHFKDKTHTLETKQKIGTANKGKCAGKNNGMHGKSAVRGRRWYHDGITQYYLFPDDPQVLELNLVLGRISRSSTKNTTI
jgi:hypothetical protein